MKAKILLLIATISFFYFTGCKDPFEPPVPPERQSLLVVEGYLNGSGPTTIQLSRTVPLNSSTVLNPVLDATVSVEGSNGSSVILTSNGEGQYTITSLALTAGEQYRVRILTAGNKEYVSDFVEYKPTPTIENVSWEKKPNGVQVLLNTQDAQNKTKYYRWTYEETWEFNSIRKSFFEWSRTLKNVVRRDPAEDIYTCWRTEPSKHIMLGSTARLQTDVINNYPVLFIPDTSWKLAVRYSILVKQYALTEDAFQYWQLMAKNTEQLGSIFDAQPSELRGNIHSTSDPNEIVIGFISAGTIQDKRIFITQQEVPGWGSTLEHCIIDSVFIDQDAVTDTLYGRLNSGVAIPLDLTGGQDQYLITSRECADCRLRGTNVKPSFW